ncbi:MAG: tyrosine-protein phosphatase [Pseudomonadota bacterium]|nr:tyrosine-protein phosphatase [Pseudomonadota bacterium]
MEMDRRLAVPGCFNVRDLGGYRSAAGETAWRRLYRADSPHRMEPEGAGLIRGAGIRTVIDLRRPEELVASPNPFADAAHGIAYHHLPIYDALDPTAPIFVSSPDPLLTLYRMALAERGPNFVAVFRTIVGATDGAVLFHCSGGKDRAGMVAAMLLRLAGVSDDDIVDDYAITARYFAPMIEALHAEALRQGRTPNPSFMLSEPQTMRDFLQTLDQDHGGAEAYLLCHGLTGDEIAALRRRLDPAADI